MITHLIKALLTNSKRFELRLNAKIPHSVSFWQIIANKILNYPFGTDYESVNQFLIVY